MQSPQNGYVQVKPAVHGDAHGFLQQPRGGRAAHVDGGIEHQQVQARLQIVATHHDPVIMVINAAGLFAGQAGNVEIRIGPLGNAELGQSARTAAVGGQALFFGEDAFNTAIEVAHGSISLNT